MRLALCLALLVGCGASRPVDDPHVRHCLDALNAYRARAGVPALRLDDSLSRFAAEGSAQLQRDHAPHAHFHAQTNGLLSMGYHLVAENQGDPNGWPARDEDAAIDQILQAMMEEGPGGGHHDHIVSPMLTAVGVGLLLDDRGALFLTNDFGG